MILRTSGHLVPAVNRVIDMLDLEQRLAPLRRFDGLVGTLLTVLGILLLPDFKGKNYVIAFIVCSGLAVSIWTLIRWINQTPIIEIRNKLLDSDYDNSFALGQKIYRNRLRREYPTREFLNPWLDRYSHGVFQAYDRHGKIWGYLSMWPITYDTFRGIMSGVLKEDDLDPSRIAHASQAPFAYWYIADIVKDDRAFSSRVSNSAFSRYIKYLMIYEGFCRLDRSGQFAQSIEVVALAVSRPGKNLLRDFRFEHIITSNEADGNPGVYMKGLHRNHLRKLLKELRIRVVSEERNVLAALNKSEHLP